MSAVRIIGTGRVADPTPEEGRYGIDHKGGRCPVCTNPAYPTDRFCQVCGTALHSGMPSETGDLDHRELDLGPVAGVCDRGVRHTTNEDAMGVAMTGSALIAVVCDGVSSTPGSGPAARAAAATAAGVLADAVRAARDGNDHNDHNKPDSLGERISPSPPGPAGREFSPAHAERAIHAAVKAAADAVTRAPVVDGRASPSCTLAAAVITRAGNGSHSVTVGWIGDSRVYLLGSDWFERLTEDDTWAAEAARAGLIPASAVETDRRAHTLTRWLGADAGDVTPHVRVFPLPTPSTVVVCTDGLWNYLSNAHDMAAVVGELPPDASALAVGRHLVQHAIQRGGHDNITVVTARVGADQPGGLPPSRTPQ